MSIDDNKHLSELVSAQLPEFVRVEHPTLVAFLSAYYEWLDIRRNEGLILSPMAMRDVPDVDRTMDQFIAEFKKEYLFQFPESLAVSTETGKPVDERKLIKTIKQFYRTKGTEKAYEFLFRILYDTGVEFYYPKTDILRLSSGKWIQNNYLRVSNELGDRIFRAAGNNIVQRDKSGNILATARVVSVSIYQKGNFNVAELLISGRNGTFRTGTGSTFQFTDGDETFSENRIYSVVSSVNITNGGEGYRPGDRVIFTPLDGGQRAYGTVVEVNSIGTIQKIKVEDFGINYEIAPTVSISSLRGSGFVGTAVVGSLCAESGYYANNDGRLSTNKVIQDNHFYQNWSYVLKSEVVIDTYREAIRKLVHPVGTAMFGAVQVKRCSRNDMGNNVVLDSFKVPFIGNYLPYTFQTFDDLKYWFGETGGYHPDVHDEAIQKLGNFPAGNPVTNDIDFLKSTIGMLGMTGVTGYTGAAYTQPVNGEDPYWFVYQHPNRSPAVSAAVGANTPRHLAKIWSDQMRGQGGFLSWDEWLLNREGSITQRQNWELSMPSGSQTADCCVGKDGTIVQSFGGASGGTGAIHWRGNNTFKYAELVYSDETEFRKLTARSFFEMSVDGKNFDCRTEAVRPILAQTAPLLVIETPVNDRTFTLKPDPTKDKEVSAVGNRFQYRSTLPVKYRIDYPQGLAGYGVVGVMGMLDNGEKIYDYRLSGSLYFSNVMDGRHKITLQFINRNNRPITSLAPAVVNIVYKLDRTNDILTVAEERVDASLSTSTTSTEIPSVEV